MRVLELAAFGDVDALRFVDYPTPKAADDEVLVHVRTVAANRMDLDVMRRRGIGLRAAVPLVLGLDPAGDVVAVGRSVVGIETGDRVVAKPSIACKKCHFCVSGYDDSCANPINLGVDRPGGFAEFVSIPYQNVLVIPDDLEYAAATALAHAAPVALLMLRERADLRSGSVVLVNGAGGSIGSSAVQVAKYFGAHVIALAGSPATVAWARDLGADEVIDRTAEPMFADHVRTVAGPAGIDVYVESVGDPIVWAEAMRTVGRRGRVVACGSHAAGSVSLDLNLLYRNRITVIGSSGSSLKTFRDAFQLISSGVIRPNIHGVMPIEDYADAYRLLLARENRGKVVFRVSG